MLSRLVWRLITPRQLRRTTLVILLMWTALAFAHHDGTFQLGDQFHTPHQVRPPALQVH
jgi:hypothetical protein